MDIKDILLPVSPEHDDRAACGVAGRLAARHGARVQGLCVTPLPALDAADCYAIGPSAVHGVLAHMDQETAAERSQAEEPFRAVIAATGCAAAWDATPPGEIAAETALRARLFDLVVLTRPTADGHELRLAEALLRLGGAPCLLVPQSTDAARAFDHVAIAWNGSRQAKRAVDDALPLLQAAERVSVVFLGRPDDLQSQTSDLIGHLERHGVKAKVEVAAKTGHDGVGDALLQWCADHDADLLVMGAFGHSPQTERWLGGTTWTALTHAQLPVLMSC